MNRLLAAWTLGIFACVTIVHAIFALWNPTRAMAEHFGMCRDVAGLLEEHVD